MKMSTYIGKIDISNKNDMVYDKACLKGMMYRTNINVKIVKVIVDQFKKGKKYELRQ